MSRDDDFASFMEASAGPVVDRLRAGDRIKGAITLIGGDSVFVELGGRADGRIPRAELADARDRLHVQVGDLVEATVVDPDADGGPLLAVTMGREQRLDLSSLQLALDTATPVEAVVKRAVKAGLEVDVGGARAFCPASQIERGYVADLTPYVDQTLRVVVTEIRDEGRSVVVSRRRALELEQAQAAQAALGRLQVGQDVEGTVASVQQYGAFVDLGGIEGLVHVSEISNTRVDRVQDVLSPGEKVKVRILAIEDGDKGKKRIRLSMKALTPAEQTPEPGAHEVLAGTVVRLLPHGLVVQTPKGQGMVPKRELGLPPGADHRRAFEVDQPLEVVLLDGRPGSYRFSAARVDDVRARQDFAEYRDSQKTDGAGAGLGSFGALLGGLDRNKLPPGPAAGPASDSGSGSASGSASGSTAASGSTSASGSDLDAGSASVTGSGSATDAGPASGSGSVTDSATGSASGSASATGSASDSASVTGSGSVTDSATGSASGSASATGSASDPATGSVAGDGDGDQAARPRRRRIVRSRGQ